MLATRPRTSPTTSLAATPMGGLRHVPRRRAATWTECPHTLSGLPCMNHQPHTGDGRGCVHYSAGIGDDE